MKRLMALLTSLVLYAVTLYVLFTYEIMPKIDSFEVYDYVIYSLAVLLPLLIGADVAITLSTPTEVTVTNV